MPRALRQTHNRELFTAVNDRIADLASTFSVDEPQGFICECSRLGCTTLIEVPLSVYQQVRQTAGAYLVVAGHENPSSEQTISKHDSYLIVLTHPEG